VSAVHAWAPARVALAGNPSDGYGGATVSLAIANFGVRASVGECECLEVRSGLHGVARFASYGALVEEIRDRGYGDPPRLLRATLARVFDLARSRGAEPGEATFSVSYETTIPSEVGLAGSSAIVVAAMLALCERFGVAVERTELPALALSVETEELGVAAGLQDRVAQSRGGLTYMDFRPAAGGPRYESLNPPSLPPLVVAWDPRSGAASGGVHSRLRERYDAREPAVVSTMAALAAQADRAKDAIRAEDPEALGAAMNATFDARRSIVELDPRHVRLIDLAREHGCAANYAGSGGAVVGLCPDETSARELERALADGGLGCERCRPARGADRVADR
jgi:glucuronokinase